MHQRSRALIFPTMKRLKWLLMWGVALLAAGCSNDEPDPDKGGAVKPDQEVADPTGTVTLSMRNDDGTSLNGLYIGEDNNFHGAGWTIASIGNVKGLGNVASIPQAGWATKVAVTPGYGYVAYDSYNDVYYRIYVTDYMEGALSGGIIGADIKYQKPFRGLDEAISFSQNKIVLPAEGGMEQVVFDNQSIIPFKVTSSADWCRVQKASTRDESFLYDAVVISCDETYAAEASTATVTIETLFGKKKEIEVTRAAYGEFITISNSELDFGFQLSEAQRSVNVYTNIVPEDIAITSSAEWLSASFSGAGTKADRAVRSIEGRPVSRATLDNPVHKEMLVAVSGYAESVQREGLITLSYGNVKDELYVVQRGSEFYIEKHTFSFDGGDSSSLSESCSMSSGNLSTYYLTAQSEDESVKWVSVYFGNDKMTVTVQPNPYEDARKATVKIYYEAYGVRFDLDEIEVTQKGTPAIDRYVYFESPSTNYTVNIPTMSAGAKVSSSADWCTATPNGTSIVLRVTAATENRSAVITVDGVSSKIYVSQSKYKVGDTYDEDGVSGEISSMADGIGRIIKVLNKQGGWQWSTENVAISGAYNSEDGRENMKAIMAIPGWKELYPAFAAVDALNVGNVSGWYLPAVSEGLNDSTWSSTQAGESYAYRTDIRTKSKQDFYAVIAMHRFSYDFTQK